MEKNFEDVTIIFPASLIAPHLIYLNLFLTKKIFGKQIVVLDSYEDPFSAQILQEDFPTVTFIKRRSFDIVPVLYNFPEEFQEVEYVNLLLTGIQACKTDHLVIQDQDDFVLDKELYFRLIDGVRSSQYVVCGLFKRTFPLELKKANKFSVTTSLFCFNKNDLKEKYDQIPAVFDESGNVLYDTFDRIWSALDDSLVCFLTVKENLDFLSGYSGMRHAISILLLCSQNERPHYQSEQDIDLVLGVNFELINRIDILRKFAFLIDKNPGLFCTSPLETSVSFVNKIKLHLEG